MLWLDHLIFGNGHGLASPYFDARFYWLSGHLYTWQGWLGSQLQSCQWTHPKAGERRTIRGVQFVPFQSDRRFLWLWKSRWFGFPLPISRVRVAWSTKLPANLDETHAFLRKFKEEIGDPL